MNSQTSKPALQGLEQAEWLAASTQTQEPTVSAELDELYRSTLPAGAEPGPPDFEGVQGANVLLLRGSARKMRQADQAHRDNRTELQKMRNRRRETAEGFKKRYRDERRAFAGTYGEDKLADVGLDAPPGTSFLEVREQLLEFRERLRDPATPAKLGEPLPGHSPIEPTTLADAVDGEISAYDTLMDEIREQQKKTQESGIVREKTLDEHRRVVVNVARVQEGYYRLVGLDKLADRIRAARRQRSTKKEEKEPPAEAAPENGATPETGAAPSPAAAQERATD